MAFKVRDQFIDVHPAAPKKDDKKSELAKALAETLGTLLACFMAVLMAIGALTVIQALCRCR